MIFVGVCFFCFRNVWCFAFLFLTVSSCAFVVFEMCVVDLHSLCCHASFLLGFRYLFIDCLAFSFIISCCLKSSSMILTSWLFTVWNHRLRLWLLACVMFQICCSQCSWSCLMSLFVGSPLFVLDFGFKFLVVWNQHLRLWVLAY